MSTDYFSFDYIDKHVCEICKKREDNIIYFGHYKLNTVYQREKNAIYAHRECFKKAFPKININKTGFDNTKDHFYRSEYSDSSSN